MHRNESIHLNQLTRKIDQHEKAIAQLVEIVGVLNQKLALLRKTSKY
ncbi:hypothetical protein [Virgibacillus proomii]|nr:hypothetical protein [Virgibacillus proomii]MBU5267192.1 hypothetical protein [Virgibacillus proomii]